MIATTSIIIITLLLLTTLSINIHAQVHINTFQCYKPDGITPTTLVTKESFCQFSQSCSPPIVASPYATSPLDPGSPFHTKSLTCSDTQFNGNPLLLTYSVDTPVVGQPEVCKYIITYENCQKKLNITLNANIVWTALKDAQSDLHSAVTQTLPTGPIADLCNQITNSNANFQCKLPYQKATPQSTCSLAQTINLLCHDHLTLCTLTSAGNSLCVNTLYKCNNSDPLSLEANCENVPLTVIRGLIADSDADVSFPTCTILRDTYCKNTGIPTNKFNCFRPWKETVVGLTDNYCELSTNFSSLQPHCGSNAHYSKLLVSSDAGQDGPHNVLYPIFFDFLQDLSRPPPAGLAKPELQIDCTISSIYNFIFAEFYNITRVLAEAVFPPITLIEFEQLFCHVTFQSCSLWQLDQLPLTCNETLRTELGMNRRRLLSVLVDHSQYNLYDAIKPFNTKKIIHSWITRLNVSDPVMGGNSACHLDSACMKLINHKFNPMTLAYHLNILARASPHDLQVSTPYYRSFHPMNVKTNPSFKIMDDDFHSNRFGETIGPSRELMTIDPDLEWTSQLWQSYLDLWCEYGKWEKTLCTDIVPRCDGQPGQTFDCLGNSEPGDPDNGLNVESYCTTFVNPSCSETGQLPLTHTFFCPASITYSHEVVCSLTEPKINCGYLCSVNNFFLTLSFVPMSGQELLDTESNAAKCNLLNERWELTTYVDGSCQAPYVHSEEKICYYTQTSSDYTLQCGVMSINCLKINDTNNLLPGYNLTDNEGNPYYNCESSYHSYDRFLYYHDPLKSNITDICLRYNAGLSVDGHTYGLSAPLVPLSYITTESALDLDVQCARLRNYVQAQKIAVPNSGYTYCCNSTTFVDLPTPEEAGMCSARFLVGVYPLIYQFNCSAEGTVWPIRCTLNGLYYKTCFIYTFIIHIY